ncbi:efflux RND transporter periplasmic adaptor subunit, partial [Roseibacterium sp. SDUM158017]|uniref:efflux RND transporter periplasmic adaptor subunit n=1 Tax=Roseicyclus salinarum TaxID=3036773 RepID=UPI0024150437
PDAARRLRRAGALAAALALVLWLAWPAPRVVTATGLARPAEAVTVALHFDAFLEAMEVSVGDTVAAGDVIAEFNAPALQERRAEVALQILVEEVSAQSALAQNDYGAFVLSEQRIAAQQRRLDNIDARLEGLSLRAPVGGRVVAAMSRGQTGSFVAAGEEVALLQEAPRFALTLEFLRVDAPLVAPGQRGEVYFRGISGESFPFLVTTPVLVERNATSGEERLTARATIEADDQSRLLTGLSGYGRILSDPAPRGLNFARYAIEYVKVRAWSYLGLRL